MKEGEKKIAAFIVSWFGSWPWYINLFIESCRTNSSVDFLLFTDNELPVNNKLPDNVKYIPMQLTEFSVRLQNVINIPVQVRDAHKVCDFKPFFGLMYTDFLKDYEFWGYCDVDVVLGDISRVMNRETLADFDLFTAHEWQTIGHFTVLRNNDYCNHLCLKIEDYKERALKMRMTFMDEWGFAKVVQQESGLRWLKPEILEKELQSGFARYNISYKHDAHIAYIESDSTITMWKEGRAYFYYKHEYIEVLYIHFMGLKHAYFWNTYDRNCTYREVYFSKNGFSPTPVKTNLNFRLVGLIISLRLKARLWGGQLFARVAGKDLKRKVAIMINKLNAK